MTRLLVLFPLLALPAAAAQDQKDPKEPQWTAHGLSIVKAGTPADDPEVREFDEGTRVTALLRIPGQFLIGIDTSQSTVEAFTDDKNTDLLKAADANRLALRLGITVSRGPADGKYAKVVFRAPGCPAAGATRVRVKGSVMVVVGKEEKNLEKKDVSLKAGIELPIGTLKVGSADSDITRTLGVPINYRGTRAIKTVVFLGADGAEIPVRRTASTTVGRKAARGEFTASFRPADRNTKLDRCTVRVTYFERVEEVVVPVNLEVGPGL